MQVLPLAFLLPILTAVALLSLGVIVTTREHGSSVSFLFALVTTTAAIWFTAEGLLIGAADEASALRWARAAFVVIPLIPASIYHFTVSLLGIERRTRLVAVLGWGSALTLSFYLPFSSETVTGVRLESWGWYSHLGTAAALAAIHQLIFLGLSLRHLFVSRAVEEEHARRARNTAFLIAFSVGYLAIFDYLPALGFSVYPFGFLGVTAFLVLSARAIWKYRLIDLTPAFAAEKILETMQGAVVVLDLEGRIRLVNRAFHQLMQTGPDDVTGERFAHFAETFESPRPGDTISRGDTVRDRRMIWRRLDGDAVDVSVSGTLLRDSQQIPCGIVYVASDLSDLRRAEEMERRAFHDALTQLPNRELFRRRLDDRLGTLELDAIVAVLFVDLNGFKDVNDQHGHDAGDAVLRHVAARLRDALRDDDLVARHGGDEFTILAKLGRPGDAAVLVEKIARAAATPLLYRGTRLSIAASIGVAIAPADGISADLLIRKADAAMYVAKRDGSPRPPRTDGPGISYPRLNESTTRGQAER